MEKDLSKWTKPQLQAQLRELGLKVSGNKPDLIKRIRDYGAGYLKMKVPQLKSLLKERKLSQVGNKIELVKRLEASDSKKKQAVSPKRKVAPKKTPSAKRKVPPKKTPSPKTPVSPQKAIADLPTELLHNILHNLNDKELAKSCKTDKRAAKICNDDLFWKVRIEKAFDYDLSKYKDNTATYRKMYDVLKKYKTAEEHLYISAKLGYMPLVKYLIKELKVTNNVDEALQAASDNAHLDVMNYLITEAKAHINFNTLTGALYSAIDRNNLDIVKYLVTHGFNVIDEHLYMAAGDGALNVLKYLITQIDLDETIDDTMYKTLSSAILTTTSNLPIVRYLVEEIGVNNLDELFLDAIESGHLDIVIYLAGRGIDIKDLYDEALDIAEEFGHNNIVKYIKGLI